MLLAGTSAVPIAAGLEGPLAGRVPLADGIETIADELWARALVLDDTYTQVAVVQVDLFALDADLLDQMRERVWEAIRLPPAGLLVVPTGAMGGPLTANLPGGRQRRETDSQYAAIQIASAVIYAARARRPAAVGWCRGTTRLGSAGGEPVAGPGVLAVDGLDGRPIAVQVELPSLPAVAGRAMTADYPGVMARALARLAPTAGSVGLLGPAAGVDPEVFSPEPLGEQLAGLAWGAAAACETETELACRVATRKLEVPLAMPSVEAAADRLERAEARLETADDPLYKLAAESEQRRAQLALELAEQGRDSTELELTAVRLGDGGWLATSALVAAPLAARLRARCGDRLQVLSGVGGVRGVLTVAELPLPTLAGFYSPLPLADQAGERWLEAAAALVEEAGGRRAIDPPDGGAGGSTTGR